MTLNETDKTGDLRYQEEILQGVSRTFALTIPQLPETLRVVIGNAYLLCRTADTIEDSAALPLAEKHAFSRRFVAVVEGCEPADAFARELAPRLGTDTLEDERDLVANTERVIRLTRTFSPDDQAALARCVRIMTEGMEEFQEGRFADGLPDQAHLDRYCYHVAGVVGEMLTSLFCAHSPETAQRRAELERLAVSFGQGLQMTNILKDIWEDRARGACWLPQATFARHGFDLHTLRSGSDSPAFRAGLRELLGIARGHLENALDYTLFLPKSERGLRQFCLWALGMAVLTLRKIERNPGFRSGQEVKIRRRSVHTVVLLSRLFSANNAMLRLLFALAARRLPKPPRNS